MTPTPTPATPAPASPAVGEADAKAATAHATRRFANADYKWMADDWLRCEADYLSGLFAGRAALAPFIEELINHHCGSAMNRTTNPKLIDQLRRDMLQELHNSVLVATARAAT